MCMVTSGKLPEAWQTNEDIHLGQEKKSSQIITDDNCFPFNC
jgi:hypothetical protein